MSAQNYPLSFGFKMQPFEQKQTTTNTNLFGTPDLFQERVQLPGFCVQSPAHCLVVTVGVGQTREMSSTELQSRGKQTEVRVRLSIRHMAFK